MNLHISRKETSSYNHNKFLLFYYKYSLYYYFTKITILWITKVLYGSLPKVYERFLPEYEKQTVKKLSVSSIKALTPKYQFNFKYITFMRAVSRYSARI
jgi:hypothetical protein